MELSNTTSFSADGRRFPLEPTALVCWLDETGHEELGDPNHPVFGLGGCATLGAEHAQSVHHPWRQMKEAHFGGADVQLHAANPRPTQTQMEGLADFFSVNAFARLAVLVTGDTVLDPDYPRYDLVSYYLMRRVVELAFPSGTQAADSVVLVFEDSQRGNALVDRHVPAAIDRACRHFLAESTIRVRRWPLVWTFGFLPKAAGSPGLEVADFIMQPAGRQALQPADRWRTRPRPDFRAVFQGQAAERGLSQFMRFDAVRG